jgi:hypothetical protein
MTMNSVLAGLAPLGLARAYEAQGDTCGSSKLNVLSF